MMLDELRDTQLIKIKEILYTYLAWEDNCHCKEVSIANLANKSDGK